MAATLNDEERMTAEGKATEETEEEKRTEEECPNQLPDWVAPSKTLSNDIFSRSLGHCGLIYRRAGIFT